MKYRYAILAFIVAYFAQTTLLNLFSLFGAAPNLLLCLVIVISFLYERTYSGILMGVVFGLFIDMYCGQFVGVSSMGYFLIGTGVVILKTFLNKENFGAMLLVTAGGTLLFNCFYWLMYYFMGSNYTFLYMLQQQPVYIIYNMIVAAIAYFVLIERVIRHRRDRYYR